MSDKAGKSGLWLRLLIVVAALAALVYGIEAYLRQTAKVEKVIDGEAVDAKPGSVVVKEEYTMQMKSAIAGRVLNKDYNLETAKPVKEGDTLVQLDTSDVEIEIEQVQNEYDAAKQRIAVGSSYKYALESAESDFVNTGRLFKLGQISDSDYQKARRGVETIKQQLALEKVRNEEDLRTDENTLKAKRHAMEKMTIKAPFSGEIGRAHV